MFTECFLAPGNSSLDVSSQDSDSLLQMVILNAHGNNYIIIRCSMLTVRVLIWFVINSVCKPAALVV